jgi:enamine deaminase RidA (YjgF/YER057c/UK114 family)
MERRSVSSGSPYEKEIGFARAVRLGQLVAVSGTAPIGSDGKTVGVGDAAAQARRCFEIAREAIEALGGELRDVVRTRMFLVDPERDWLAVGRVHGEYFRDLRPAATMVGVPKLIDPEWLVEIELDAWIDRDRAG